MSPPLYGAAGCSRAPARCQTPSGRVFLLAVRSMLRRAPPSAKPGGSEQPSAVCGQVLLFLHSYDIITVSRMSSIKYAEVVTI